MTRTMNVQNVGFKVDKKSIPVLKYVWPRTSRNRPTTPHTSIITYSTTASATASITLGNMMSSIQKSNNLFNTNKYHVTS